MPALIKPALAAIGLGLALLAPTAVPAAVGLTLGGGAAAADESSASGALAPDESAGKIAPVPPALATTLTIPTITAVDSSMSETAIREALSGRFMDHAAEIAGLTATSISIPEITLTIDAGGEAPVHSSVSYKDIVLSGVKDGVAAEVSVGGSIATSAEGTFSFGKLSAKGLDIGALMAFYSVVPADDPAAAMKPLYTDFRFDGGSFSGPSVECKLGAVSAAEFDARPLKVSFAELMAATSQLEDTSGAPPSEAMTTVIGFLADMFQAFKSEPVSLDGLSCAGTDEQGQPFDLGVGNITLDGYRPGIYPALTMKDFKLTSGATGNIGLAQLTFKSTDLTQPIAAIESAGSELSADWFASHYRSVIPAFGGFSFSGLDIDVPSEDVPGGRIQAKVADFDLTLGNYVNGVPTLVSTKANGIDVPLPQDSTDDSVKMLLALGLSRVNLNFEVSAAWDKANSSIALSKVAISGNNLGSIALAAVIGNATEQLFATDPNIEQAAALNLTLKGVTLDLVDNGIADTFLPMLAQSEGITDIGAYRAKLAGGVEGTVLQILGSTEQARSLGAALGDFISGKAKSVTVKIDATNPNGLPLPLLMQAQSDPSALNGEVTVSGSAR